jgi:hypothetical protein
MGLLRGRAERVMAQTGGFRPGQRRGGRGRRARAADQPPGAAESRGRAGVSRARDARA